MFTPQPWQGLLWSPVLRPGSRSHVSGQVASSVLLPAPWPTPPESRVTEEDGPAQVRVRVTCPHPCSCTKGCFLAGVHSPARLGSAYSSSQPMEVGGDQVSDRKTALLSKAAFSLSRETRLLSQRPGLWPRHMTVTCWLSWRVSLNVSSWDDAVISF